MSRGNYERGDIGQGHGCTVSTINAEKVYSDRRLFTLSNYHYFQIYKLLVYELYITTMDLSIITSFQRMT